MSCFATRRPPPSAVDIATTCIYMHYAFFTDGSTPLLRRIVVCRLSQHYVIALLIYMSDLGARELSAFSRIFSKRSTITDGLTLFTAAYDKSVANGTLLLGSDISADRKVLARNVIELVTFRSGIRVPARRTPRVNGNYHLRRFCYERRAMCSSTIEHRKKCRGKLR